MSGQPRKLSRARRWSRVAVWTIFAVVLFVRFGPLHEWFEPPPRRQPPFNGPGQYRRPPTIVRAAVSEVPADLWRLHIQIADKDVQVLRSHSWNGWQGARQDRPEVLATLREGGTVYTNVALHLKGAAGSFRPFDDKPALTLNFSKHAPKQKFHGYSKLSFNNSVQDSSYLCEAISRELFEAAGVPVPRAGHATVLINGRDLGLYVFTEGYGKPFLKRYFENVTGNLYDGGFCQEVSTRLDTNSGDHPEDRSDLERLLAAAMEPDSGKRWQRLSQVLDLDRFISLMAMEVMTCHWDGYAGNRNNYRLFHDMGTDRMIFMPHGLDQMFGVMRAHPTDPIDPQRLRIQGLVAQAVISTAEGHRLYLDRIANLRTNVFLEDRLTNRVLELAQRLRPTLAAYGPAQVTEHERSVARLCNRITERARSISEQLAAPLEPFESSGPIEFDETGVAKLSRWTNMAPQGPGLRFRKTRHEGKDLLQVTANRGGGTGSWRTPVILAAGRYRFEALVRAVGLSRSGGVSLRISGSQVALRRLPEGEWVPLHYMFVIREPIAERVLVCEVSASTGEVWFDVNSLRLVQE